MRMKRLAGLVGALLLVVGIAVQATAGAASTKIDPNKPPVVFALNALKVSIVDLLTPYQAGANAAANEINAMGGIGGRKVVIASCNTMYTAAVVEVCAHQTLAQHPVAEFGCDPVWPNAGLPVYTAAKVMSINCPNVPMDYTSPWNVAITGGQDGDQRASARWMCTQPNIKKVVVFTQDIAIEHIDAPASVGPTLAACHKTVSYIYYPITGVDLTPYVTKAAQDKPDFVLTLGGGVVAVKIFQLFQQAGIPPSHLMASANAFAYQSVLKLAGSAMNGAYSTLEVKSWGDTSDPSVAAYLKAMKGSGVDAQDPNPETAYAEVMMLYAAAKQIGFSKFNAASFAKWTRTANNVQLPTSRTFINPGPKGYPSIKQPYDQIVQWKGGKLHIVTSGTANGWVRTY